MFIEFSVRNFRSFRDLTTFSMIAAAIRSKDPEVDANNRFALDGQPDLLTSAAVYGANASGKSNLVKAIGFMRHFVLDSVNETQATGGIDIDRFRLSVETAEQAAHFEAVFIVDGTRYRYGFEITAARVESEWLFVVPTVREALLFTRTGDEISLGERFGSAKSLFEFTRPNALFLSVAAQFNHSLSQRLVGWFRKLGIATGVTDVGMRVWTMRQILESDDKQAIVGLVKRMDLGIEELEVEKLELSDLLQKEIPSEAKELLDRMGSEKGGDFLIVSSTHTRYDAAGRPAGIETFDFDEQESEGTKRLFALAGPVVNALRQGQVLIIDELDARLHPLMTSGLVKLFNNKETNPNHAQLIFTTHDTNLLDKAFFRRDQIWFAEKDRTGATHLYSLVEFKVRNDASFERDYIKGRFGAIPYLGDLARLGESN